MPGKTSPCGKFNQFANLDCRSSKEDGGGTIEEERQPGSLIGRPQESPLTILLKKKSKAVRCRHKAR